MKDSVVSIIVFASMVFTMIFVINAGFGFTRTADNASSGEMYELNRVANVVELNSIGKYLNDEINLSTDVTLDQNVNQDGYSGKCMVYGDTVKKALLHNENRVNFIITGYDGQNLDAIKTNYVYAVKVNGDLLSSGLNITNNKVSIIEYEKIGIREGSDS